MAIQIYKEGQHTENLEVVGGKLNVKTDNSGNVQFSTTSAGLKGEVTLPEAEVAVKEITLDGNTIKATKSDGTATTLQLPELPIDVSLANAELTEDNKLKFTLTNDEVREVPLSALIPPPKTVQDLWTEIQALPTFKQDLLNILKGEELQGLDGVAMGYLLPNA